MELTEPTRLAPLEPSPDLPYFDDDWFRYYYQDTRDNIVFYEVHEMDCIYQRCAYRPEPCPWHPKDCDCSFGACREMGTVRMKEMPIVEFVETPHGNFWREWYTDIAPAATMYVQWKRVGWHQDGRGTVWYALYVQA